MENTEEYDHLIKVVLTGDAATGKSSLLYVVKTCGDNPKVTIHRRCI
jgi:hypothetical protein